MINPKRPKDRFERKPHDAPVTLEYFRERSTINPETGCWVWNGCIGAAGYGVTGVRRLKSKQAHRAAYMVATGEKPSSLLDICHSCDVRACVNPEHLFVGTRRENMQDALAKGRLRTPFFKGQPSPSTKLTEAQVREIRADALSSNRDLARLYHVSRRAIQFIKQRRTWGHVQ